jgi:hypothetical protein
VKGKRRPFVHVRAPKVHREGGHFVGEAREDEDARDGEGGGIHCRWHGQRAGESRPGPDCR